MKVAALLFPSLFAFVQAADKLTLNCPSACDLACLTDVSENGQMFVTQLTDVYLGRKWSKIQRKCNEIRRLGGLRGNAEARTTSETSFSAEEFERELFGAERDLRCNGNNLLCRFYGWRRDLAEEVEDKGERKLSSIVTLTGSDPGTYNLKELLDSEGVTNYNTNTGYCNGDCLKQVVGCTVSWEIDCMVW